MKIIKIDAAARTVSEKTIDGSLESLQKEVAGYIEVATTLENGDILIVNEEGLITPGIDSFFTITGGHQPFAGDGVIVGDAGEGEWGDAASSVATIQSAVQFHTLDEVRRRPR